MADTLPKGINSKTSSANKTGIAIVIVIMAVAISVGGLAFTGIIPMPETPEVQQEPTTPLSPMQSPTAPISALDLIDQLQFKISNGDVKSMLANELDNTLVITVDTYDDGELFIGLDDQFMAPFNDGTYFVIVDGEEFNGYEQAGTELYIPFELGTEKIEIVGSYILS
tara:strand:- start:152 stop:655 length:504 start_codon:yes stop_codon:yes gene_type:complete